MKTVSGKEFTQILIRHGWQLRRINGSHHIFTKAGSPARISVPVHGNESLKIGLLRHLMKLAGIDQL
ncbi:MAG TPA: type II toxin-antitoxin system HicA family toxin [Rhodanobacteraceae bacterium]|nr:type II toxin-antitoxin system HicA family toxin [Rhodanobacteraceae bacterium]